MPEVQAQRTLVKSPPELWAELSDGSALARRLELFGEIRITRVEPEKTVAWEGERASGTVELEASGWGTRVTLTAEPSPADPPEIQAQVSDEPRSPEGERPMPQPREPEPTGPTAVTALPEPEPEPEALPGEPDSQDVAPLPRRRIFRIFGRARRAPFVAETTNPNPPPPPLEPVPDPDPFPRPEPVPDPMPDPEPLPDPEPDPEPPELEPAARSLPTDHARGLLEAVLDDLGSAHHRPFSRG